MIFSVVIPTCSRNDLLARCLDRLSRERQTFKDSYEVIVTDDGSGTTAEEMIRSQYPWARWVPGPRKGPAANRNNGAKMASAEWLAFLDDDCIPDATLLTAYAEAITQQKETNVFEGRIYVDRPCRSLAEVSPVNETGGYLWSCNFAIRRSLFGVMNGFEEQFRYACMEDVDFRQRLALRKEQFFFVREASVCHPWRPSRGARGNREVMESLSLYLKLHPEAQAERIPSRYIAMAFRNFVRATLPGVWKYRGAGFFNALREHVFHVRLAWELWRGNI